MTPRPVSPRPWPEILYTMRMTDARKREFLAALRRDGVVTRAALTASPGALGSAVQSFRDERERDPEFALRWLVVRSIAP